MGRDTSSPYYNNKHKITNQTTVIADWKNYHDFNIYVNCNGTLLA
jgi:hypothetical protein